MGKASVSREFQLHKKIETCKLHENDDNVNQIAAALNFAMTWKPNFKPYFMSHAASNRVHGRKIPLQLVLKLLLDDLFVLLDLLEFGRA